MIQSPRCKRFQPKHVRSMYFRTKPFGNKRSGFTLLEVVMTTTILGVLARSLIQLADGMGSMSKTGGSMSLMQFEATKAQSAMMADLRRSGLLVAGARSLPHVFENGVPEASFEIHAHTPAAQSAMPGESDFGAHRSIVFLLPADFDEDGRPDLDVDLDGFPELDGNGDGVYSDDVEDLVGWDATNFQIDGDTGLVWDLAEYSYQVRTGPDGRNYLEKRRAGVLVKHVAKDVERLFVETPAQTGFVIPTNALRFSLFLRKQDTDGVTYRHSVQWVSSLRNGELE